MEAVIGAAARSREQEPTFFELLTAIALWYFAREKVDWVVWETGLGGRLDATNIVTPQVCIITNIGLEHQQYLGDTMEKIAAEKAGIIKPGVPVVTSATGGALDLIGVRASDLHCNLVFAAPQRRELRIRGRHQEANAACAAAAAKCIGVVEAVVDRGLANAVWPGRFDVISEKPLIVLDGAHNPDGVRALAESWRDFLRARGTENAKAHVLFACAADKNIAEMADFLRPIASHISLVRLGHERGANLDQISAAFNGLPQARYESVADAWQNLQHADPSSLTLVTGSLFLVGEMLALQQGAGEEYRLNERLEKPL
jgi:dihydrofolate synthase/folylpolyglutamate synthase